MKALIIEDEKPAARKLERMLLANGLEVEAILHSVESAVQWLQTHSYPPLIFSDIQLGDGLSFDIFETFPINKSFIIFTTAFDQYTLRAFKLNSIDYLLKPINDSELKAALEKFRNISLQEEGSFQGLLKNLFSQEQEAYKERFLVKIGNFLKPIYTQNISCFFSENKITYLQTSDRNLPVDFTLDELEIMLNPKVFFRISRQYIVHIKSIKEIIAYSNSRLQIKVENLIEPAIVSRERVRDFKTWLGG